MMVVRKRYKPVLAELGLTDLAGVEAAEGALVKDQRGKRDVLRLTARGRVYFLKRIRRTKAIQTLETLLTRRRLRSLAGIEWDNLVLLRRHRIRVAEPIAFGERIRFLRERFSFILVGAAPGEIDLRDFVEQETDPTRRRLVLDELAAMARRLHDAGFATPDLFARHLFIQWRNGRPRFTLIDMARLDRSRRINRTLRARDLAGLNSSLPHHLVSPADRLRFLHRYCGCRDHDMLLAVRRRMEHLLRRNKRLDFYTPAPRTS